MIHLSRREKYILILTSVIIFGTVSYNLILEPYIAKWRKLDREIALKEIRLKKSSRLLKNRSVTKKYNYYASLPHDISGILSCIENNSRAMGIKASNIKPGLARRNNTYGRGEIELEIEGEIKNIERFLSVMTAPPVRMGLRQFDFSSQPKNPTRLKGTIILSTQFP